EKVNARETAASESSRMNEFPENENADCRRIRGLFRPQSNPQHTMSCTTSAYFGSPRGLVSCCKTESCYSDKGDVSGSRPPVCAIFWGDYRGLVPKISIHNPPHTSLSSSRQLRGSVSSGAVRV